MSLYILGLVAVQLLVTLFGSCAAVENVNKPIVVNLRIEGAARTIFEGPITTNGHNVSTPSGGTHHCDGTNNGANRFPSATATSALDDAADQGRFSWDGTFDTEFDDYLVTRIDGSSQTSKKFWLLVVNFAFAQVGGCQLEVTQTDEVLWAFGSEKSNFLKLAGPATVRQGHPITVTVTDGGTGRPVAGATVGGKSTGKDGTVCLTFTDTGLQKLKAEHQQSIRSNTLEVKVKP